MENGKHVYPHPKFETKETQVMNVGEERVFVAKIYGAENVRYEAPITYRSDNPDILTIDQDGRVKTLKEGYGEILAFSCGKLARLGIEAVSVPRGIKGFTAHRGVRALAPENTMAAFKKAANYHFDYIETDIQVTKDKQLVLFHDDTLKRMLGIAEKHIHDYTLAELKKMKFTSGNHLEEYPDACIPTFEEYLSFIAKTDCAPMIELKDPSLSRENKDQLPIIKQLIDKYDLAAKARVTSAILDNILAYEPYNEKSQLTYIVEDPEFRDLELLKKHHFLFSIKYSAADKDFLKKVQEAGLDVDIWIINDKLKAKELLSWPITSMTSDTVIFDH